ncbi:MAG TPA: hypothetical protein VL327_11645 [Pyrinomonadaceae bacterium]|jgi:hypothetical protein|nr:hypothetical protein [Pyrinomonadaceae bacterium]
MNDRKFDFFLKLFQFTLGIVVLIQSLLAVVHSLHEPLEGHVGKVLPWFAGLEAIAAVLLLIPQTIKIGGWILLAIFAIAIVVHGPVQGLPLIVYAAGVLLVMFCKQAAKEE